MCSKLLKLNFTACKPESNLNAKRNRNTRNAVKNFWKFFFFKFKKSLK